MQRNEIAEAFARACWQDQIAKLTAEGKLPTLPEIAASRDLIGTHIGYENLEPSGDEASIQS